MAMAAVAGPAGWIRRFSKQFVYGAKLQSAYHPNPLTRCGIGANELRGVRAVGCDGDGRKEGDASMAAFIPAFAKKRIWPDRAADFRRDWRSNGDRHSTGHGYHYRPRAEVTKHGTQGAVLRHTAVAAPAQ